MRVSAPLMGNDRIEHETRYPDCLTCKQRCHGCSFCGFVFTCSKCEPCHEGLVSKEDLI